jgi:hypothetical protein
MMAGGSVGTGKRCAIPLAHGDGWPNARPWVGWQDDRPPATSGRTRSIDRKVPHTMIRPRALGLVLALTGALAGPAAALAGAGQSAHYLPTLRAPAVSPVAIHGGDPRAFLHTGERLHRGEALMRVRVNTPQDSGLRLRFTCPSGAVTGYGYQGADALAVNGRRILSQHTVRPKVQAAADRNHDGRFTGTVYAYCEGGR